jgi:predicted NAD-dependent protein-ADP-ribosyltransferase YbiA (DUF1768 family)
MLQFLLALCLLSVSVLAGNYPEEWFRPIPREQASSWEILPQDARAGEVILSKRTELGIFSNFAATSFIFRGKLYASIEGFWQLMKFPDENLDGDIRFTKAFPFTRDQVAAMTAFEAKDAGSIGSKFMKELKIDWVSFEGQSMIYCSLQKGLHYQLIYEAMWEKLQQNPEVKRLLLATGDLILRPDHKNEGCQAPEWAYHQMWMEIRELMKTLP